MTAAAREKQLFGKTAPRPGRYVSSQYARFGKQIPQLIFIFGKRRHGIGIHQQNQIIAAFYAGFQIPVRLSAEPLGMVPLDGGSKAAGKGKANPAAGQAVFQRKKFRPAAAGTLSPVKHLPDVIPSL